MIRKTALIAVAAIMASPVNAQTAAPVATSSANAKYASLHKFAACEMKINPSLVVEFAIDSMRGASPGKYRAIGNRRCVAAASSGNFNVGQINGDVLAGAVAEQVLANVDPATDARLATAPAIARPRLMTLGDFQRDGWMTRAQFDKQMAMEAGERSLDEAAECVVRRAPTASRAVFTASYGTPAATAAVDALRPDLGTCLGNTALRLTPFQLRGALALNYLRLAVAADPSLKAKLI